MRVVTANGQASFSSILGSVAVFVLLSLASAGAQQPPPREFPPGTINRIEDLPLSRFRARVQALPPQARQRALEILRSFHFTESDLPSLETDSDGGIFYVDSFEAEPEPPEASEPAVAEAAVPVSPFPASLIFHSRPGAPNVLYLNFAGENVTGTAWNTSLERSVIPALGFSTDGDYSTFSDAEQTAIKRLWQRVAEDYAPFNIDVTTERPAAFGTRTAHALITRSTDANGSANPSSTAGGIAYVNVFGSSSYASFRPAWIYYNNLSSSESLTAEAVSHEIGHNLGLSHDGKTGGTAYYSGHGSGSTSWGPIMGTAYSRNVTQWSRGDYYLANNTQDDLATIAAKISYRSDDHGDSHSSATPLVITGGTNVVSTTPENDPANANLANKGTLGRNTDVDVFSFTTGGGPINVTVTPWISPSGARGGNLDILAELYNAGGTRLLTNNTATQTWARIQTTLGRGTYYLHVRSSGVGDPFSASPTGYTDYASIGQYFISGYVAAAEAIPSPVQLTATVNNPAWGTVNPTSASYAAGSTAEVLATPAPYYRFVAWTNGAAGTSNPLTLVLQTNTSVQAMFAEIMTINHPTPHWWLASYGYTSNFETAVAAIGANGLPLWQSYIAGLNPNDRNSQVRLSIFRALNANILSWNTVSGRVYTVSSSTNAASGFTPLAGASGLPWTTQRLTNAIPPGNRSVFYRLEVRLP